ncbi:sigma-70 family RNA polymerase sigma factor [Cryptosporangium phraense]|uniref:Sigma-70 family RNA polymerase sigma factor n=1 Tax=Cryptosporangium phraense TaxID=2593070 RepID=A0A545ASM3_9ACTN|nr:sigma-70 family RNA polymerase sigma factor [Cryptosporangium phraense]TQS44329.1 sigma-70 family RNA polymerase sigma factor [Cryptosporangium phraense]
MSCALAGVPFVDVYLEHRGWITRYVASRVMEYYAVEDLVQETFLRALAQSGDYDGTVDGIGSWLTGRAACAVGDYVLDRRAYLRAGHEVHRQLRLPAPVPYRRLVAKGERQFPAPPLLAPRLPLRADLAVALSRLPETQRRTIQLRFLEGLTLDVCADLLGVKQITIVRRQRQALAALRSSTAVAS